MRPPYRRRRAARPSTARSPIQAAVFYPGVTVKLQSPATGLQRDAVTNAAGVYVFNFLSAGIYDVSAELSGFKSVRHRHDHSVLLKVIRGGADSTDGIEVAAGNLGPDFPHGLLVAMNSRARNFLMFGWDDIFRLPSRQSQDRRVRSDAECERHDRGDRERRRFDQRVFEPQRTLSAQRNPLCSAMFASSAVKRGRCVA